MDKNNDIQVNKVSKWDKDIAEESLWQAKKSVDAFLCGYSPMLSIEALDAVRTIYVYLDEALDRFNELEARHQKDTGLISEYEEENKDLKTILAMRERDANMAKNLCHSIAFNMVEFHKGEVKKEEENCQGLNKIITRKNAEMCNLKWERDETEKKIKILIDELKKQYDINVTFYQKPGIDMHGLKNFGVHIDCEENRKAFLDLKEALDKYKAKNEKLEEKHEKATRYISRLTEALNNAGVEFHYVKIGDDGEEMFHIDSLIDKLAKKHYEAQYNNLRDVIRERNDIILHLESKICKLKEFLKKNGRPVKYGKDATWCWDFEDGAWDENEERVAKLVSALDKCHMDARWDRENGKWCIYVRPSDTELTRVSFDLCEVIEGYEKLKEENNNLTTDAKRLSDAVNAWFNMFNDMRHKRDDLKKENKKLEEALNDKNKLIYKLTPRKGNIGDKIVPPTGCCGCCNICKQRDICWILND